MNWWNIKQIRTSCFEQTLLTSNIVQTISDEFNTILLNKLEPLHLLVIELEHLNFGFERMNIEPKKPLLKLLNYSSNRLKHHFFEH